MALWQAYIKRGMRGVLVLLVALSLSACSLLTPTRDEVLPDETLIKLTTPAIATKGVLTVGISADDAPQVMEGTSGELQGYLVDVAYALGNKLGLDVEFVTEVDVEDTGDPGEPDIYLGAVAEDATSEVSITGTALEDAPALFTKAETSAVSALSAEALSGVTIAVQDGSNTQDLLVKSGISCEQKTYSNVNECIAALDAGEVQYAACDATAGAYLSRVYTDIVYAGSLDTPSVLGIAMRTSNTDLVETVSTTFNELSTDGTIDAIHVAWYGRLPISLSDTLISGITTPA